jgi:hypothetical protein
MVYVGGTGEAEQQRHRDGGGGGYQRQQPGLHQGLLHCRAPGDCHPRYTFRASTLYRKSDLFIPGNETARPHSYIHVSLTNLYIPRG